MPKLGKGSEGFEVCRRNHCSLDLGTQEMLPRLTGGPTEETGQQTLMDDIRDSGLGGHLFSVALWLVALLKGEVWGPKLGWLGEGI